MSMSRALSFPLSRGLSRPLTLSQGGGQVGDPNRYMFFATRNKVPSGNVYAAPTAYAGSRICFATPQYAVNDFRFHWSGFSLTEGGNGPQETQVPGNDTIIDGAWLYANAALTPLAFSGNAGVTIASGTLGAWCDAVVLSAPVAAESEITVITAWHAAGNFIPVYRWQAHRGEKAWSAASLVDLMALIEANAPSSAAWLTSYGTLNQLAVYGPDFMVAKGAWDGRPVAVAFTDSIGLERQEYGPNADARGNLGWLRRWLDKSAGIGRIPHMPIGAPGAAALREFTGSGATIATMRRTILNEIYAFNGNKWPFTVIINQYGQNDSTTPYSAYLSRLVTFINSRVRTWAPGVKIVGLPPIGRTSNNIEYNDASVVTYAANNTWPVDATDASAKWRLRADIIAKTSGICDDYIDTLDAWQGVAGVAKPPMYTEFPWSTLTAQAGTDGVAAYTTFEVADASGYLPEQQLRVYSADGLTLLGSGNIVGSISGNTITIQATTLATVYPAGSRLYQAPVNLADGLHPMPVLIRKMVADLPQTNKTKLVA